MEAVVGFLTTKTPSAWCDRALSEIDTLLLDHASLELKAAHQAQQTIWKYGSDRGDLFLDQKVRMDLIAQMSRLAREELRHFEQVLAILEARGLQYSPVSASGYAAALHEHIRECEPERLIDSLIVGALIEARSCERFCLLSEKLAEPEPALAKFYRSLLRSEARHFNEYLETAQRVGGTATAVRVEELRRLEGRLMFVDSPQLRFHSGVAMAAADE
jgi:tRNA-(ms[2]io[6]A)-hydroxylase